MKKKRSLSGKGISGVRINWDAVRSFISDVEVKDRIPEDAKKTVPVPKPKPAIEEKKKSNGIEDSAHKENHIVNRNNQAKKEPSKPTYNEPEPPIRMKAKEKLMTYIKKIQVKKIIIVIEIGILNLMKI